MTFGSKMWSCKIVAEITIIATPTVLVQITNVNK